MFKAPLNRIIPFSSVDGPGNRVAIFFQSCNFNCKFCHNPETINMCSSCGGCVPHCPAKALSIDQNKKVIWDKSLCVECHTCIKKCGNNSSPMIEWVTPEELFNKVKPYLPFVSGVTVSGGEATLHHEFLAVFLKLVKEHGKTAFVDSNGLLDFKEMPHLVEVMDKAMIDVKSVTEEEHEELVGKSCETVLENVRYLASIDKLFEIRTVVIPEVLNNELNVETASKLISANHSVRYKIIKYRQNGVRKHMLEAETPTNDYMSLLEDIAHQNGVLDVVII